MSIVRDITDSCVAVALYGISASTAPLASSFYTELIEWFKSVECPPSKLSVHGSGFGGKPLAFAPTDARVCKKGFCDITSLTLFAELSEAQLPTVDWWAIASLDFANGGWFAIAARSSVTTLEDERLVYLVKRCVTLLNPAYGIGYHLEHDKGPLFYAIGLNYAATVEIAAQSNGLEQTELAISRWGDLGMVKEVYKRGLLRDVYPHNYLSEPQLKKDVNGQTLEDWIEANPSRGDLVAFRDQMKLWKVAEAHLKSVRDELRAAGVIFDWQNHLDE